MVVVNVAGGANNIVLEVVGRFGSLDGVARRSYHKLDG